MSALPSAPPAPSPEPAAKNTGRKKLFAAGGALLGLGLLALVIWLFGGGPIAFSITLDGRALTSGVEPQVRIDGKAYSPLLPFRAGPHDLAVTLPNAEPFARKVWIVWGRRDLGALPLSSRKGAIKVDVTPSPAAIALRQGTEKLRSGNAPITWNDVPVGSYVMEVSRGDYSEYKPVEVAAGATAELKVALNVGAIDLSASANGAEYEITGAGRKWEGKLPARVADVPAGGYTLRVRHKGWEQSSDFTVRQGDALTRRVEFPYGSIAVESDPPKFAVAKDSVPAGLTPVQLDEVKPGHYRLSATDGENEIVAEIDVAPHAALRHVFVFRYGAVQLDSTPAGAAVFHRGKEVGRTPLKLEHLLEGDTELELRLPDYASSRVPVRVGANETTQVGARLFHARYVDAMQRARDALAAAQFTDAQNSIAAALEAEPEEPAALQLRDDVAAAAARAAEAARLAAANARTQEIAALPSLDFPKAIADCTDTREVQYTVQLADGYYQEYIDEKDHKKKQRFVQTGQHSETRTRTEATFNPTKFAQNYRDRTFRFSCPDRWSVAKIEKDGSIILKGGGAGSDEIKVTPARGAPGIFSAVQKGQKVAIKGVLRRYDAGGLFVPRSFYLDEGEMLDDPAKIPAAPSVSVVRAPASTAVEPPPPGDVPVPSAAAAVATRDELRFNGVAPLDISQVDQPPVAKFRIPPKYPLEMRRANVDGNVLVDFIVDLDGNVQNARALRSSRPEFEAAAVQAVSKWKFRPGRKAGRDVYTRMQVPIVFTLNQ